MKYEFLNRIIIRGIVGNVNYMDIGRSDKLVNLDIVTEYCYLNDNGETTMDLTWFNVRTYEKTITPADTEIKKGAILELEGRIVNRRYVNENGETKYVQEVIAKKVKILGSVQSENEKKTLSPETKDSISYIEE